MIRKNQPFIIGLLLFLIIGAILLLNIEQGEETLYFSQRRGPFIDAFFVWFTKLGEEYVYITLIIAFLFVRFRYSLLVLLAGLLAIGVSYLLKGIFRHPRPSVFFKDQGTFDQLQLVDGVHLLSGHMSFPSGHTISAFLLFGLIAFLFTKKRYWNFALFLVALLIGISRIYLVQHFLKDVYLGAIIGTLLAMLLVWFNSRFPYSKERLLDRSLLRIKGKSIQA